MLVIPFSHSRLNKCMTIKMKVDGVYFTAWDGPQAGTGEEQVAPAGSWVTDLTLEEDGLIQGPAPTPSMAKTRPPTWNEGHGTRDSSGFVAMAPRRCLSKAGILFLLKSWILGLFVVSHPPIVEVAVEICSGRSLKFQMSEEPGGLRRLPRRCGRGQCPSGHVAAPGLLFSLPPSAPPLGCSPVSPPL